MFFFFFFYFDDIKIKLAEFHELVEETRIPTKGEIREAVKKAAFSYRDSE